MTPERLKQIRERTDAATPGPWVNLSNRLYRETGKGKERRHSNLMKASDGGSCWIDRDEDAAFLAHSRADVPALIDYVEALERIVFEAADESALARQAFVMGQNAFSARLHDWIKDVLRRDEADVSMSADGPSYGSGFKQGRLHFYNVMLRELFRLAPEPFDVDAHRREAGSFRLLTDLKPGAKVVIGVPEQTNNYGENLRRFCGQEAAVIAVYLRREKLDDHEVEYICLALRLPDGSLAETDLSNVRVL